MLLQQIDEDLKKAQKEKNDIAVSALRNLKAAVKNFEIEKQHELSEDEVASVITKKVKQHKDSITEFEKGQRLDLVAIEKSQMSVLQGYLPEAMSEAALDAIVKEVILNLSATSADFGKVMKEVVLRVKGQADGSMISKIVKENLSA